MFKNLKSLFIEEDNNAPKNEQAEKPKTVENTPKNKSVSEPVSKAAFQASPGKG